MNRFIPLSLALLVLLTPSFAHAEEPPNQGVMIRVHDISGRAQSSFYPFGETYFGRVSIASADITGDGTDEIIVGPGHSEDPIVKVFSIVGEELFQFTAYHPLYRQGVNVTACDLDGDGKAEIITGARAGGGPHVRVFDPTTGLLWNNTEFFAYDMNFRGGVHVACGNVDSDEDIEILTGPGISGGPHLKIFSSDGTLKHERFVGSMPSNNGLQVTVSDLDREGPSEILTTGFADGQHDLFVLRATENDYEFTDHILLGEELTNVSLSTFDYGRETEEILVSHSYNESTVSVLALDGTTRATFSPFTSEGHGAQTIALRTPEKILQVSVNDSGTHRLESGKFILIDISEQRLLAFENGGLSDTFLISSGLPKYETPRGRFSVTDKLPTHTYRWVFGTGDQRNYVIPNVKWNLRFKQYYYLHSATWHNNFGKKMSHGCVNLHPIDAERIFSWSDVNTVVEIID